VTVLASKAPEKVATAVVFPLPLKDTRKGEGSVVSERLAEALMQEGYAEKALLDDRFPPNDAEAARLARDAGGNVAVVGTIDEFFYGGISTTSHVRITLRVLDVATGQTTWHLVGSLSSSPRPPRDRYFFVARGEEAVRPIVLAESLSREMARILAGHPTKAPEPAPVELPNDKLAPRDAGSWQSY
jgi:hypothetical protein